MSTSPVSLSMVLSCVSVAFGPSVRELRSSSRMQPIARARHAACLIAAELTGLQKTTIGRHLSSRDGSTVSHAIEVAAALCRSDADYAAKVDTAREAAQQLARTSVAARLADIDATAVANRICRDLAREPSLVSSDQIIALAVRVLDLDDVAGGTCRLLAALSRFEDAPAGQSFEDQVLKQRIGAEIRAVTETLSSALLTLGYGQPEGHDDDSHDDTNA